MDASFKEETIQWIPALNHVVGQSLTPLAQASLDGQVPGAETGEKVAETLGTPPGPSQPGWINVDLPRRTVEAPFGAQDNVQWDWLGQRSWPRSVPDVVLV